MSKWPLVRLGDVCTINMGQSPSSESYNEKNEGIPFYQGNADFGEIHPDVRIYCNNPTKIANKNDILLSVRAPIGALNIAIEKCCIGRGLCAITEKENISYYKYIYYVLKRKKAELISKGTGSTFKAINKENLTSIRIPLPPFVDQKHIADTLDKNQEIIGGHKKQLVELGNLIKAVFYEMFGDPFDKINTQTRIFLTKIADIIMGQSPQGDSYNNKGYGIPLLNGPTEFGEMYPQEKQWTSEPTKLCAKDDILFCVRGATAGRMNIADKQYCIGRGLAAIRARKAEAREYIYFYLHFMYNYFQTTSSGSTFINITKNQLENMPIIYPSSEGILRFSRIITKIKEQKAIVKQAITESEHLFNSLMSEYFD